jgi:hypothetical protein
MHMHGFTEKADDPFRAHPARFFLVWVAPLALQQLVFLHGHASPANPVIPIS